MLFGLCLLVESEAAIFALENFRCNMLMFEMPFAYLELTHAMVSLYPTVLEIPRRKCVMSLSGRVCSVRTPLDERLSRQKIQQYCVATRFARSAVGKLEFSCTAPLFRPSLLNGVSALSCYLLASVAYSDR